MPVEKALVIEKSSFGKARVQTRRGADCHTCSARGACNLFGNSSDTLEVEVNDPIGVSVGDQVEIALSSNALLKSSLIIYFLPALGIIIGAIVGFNLLPVIGIHSDAGALLGSGIFLVLFLLASQIWGWKRSKDQHYIPTIVKVIQRSGDVTKTSQS